MNPTPQHNRISAIAEEVFGPVRASRGTFRHRALVARSAFAYVGVITTLVQVVVWLTIGVLSGHLDSPWWLWTTVPAAGAVVVLTLVDHWHSWWTSDTTAPTSR